jgi:hypothetical protein
MATRSTMEAGFFTDAAERRAVDSEGVSSSYPVVWQTGEELPLAGRLELTEEALRLYGGDRGNETRLVIPYGDLLGLERDPVRRLGRCRAITIFSRSTGELLVASVGGVGLLSEVFAALQQALAG